MFMFKKSLDIPSKADALPGRPNPIRTAASAFRQRQPAEGALSGGARDRDLRLGLLLGRRAQVLGARRRHLYDRGRAMPAARRPNPTYEEVCSGRTGHNEVVLVVYDPKKISYEKLLKTFWENHDPTQGMRQGNDVGTQYRSGIYTTSPAQKKAAEESKAMFGKALAAKRFGAITTEILDAPPFYFAEDYHQQYLAKNPMGYCGLGGTGVSCPIGTGVGAAAH